MSLGGPLVSAAPPTSARLVGLTPRAGVTGEQGDSEARMTVCQMTLVCDERVPLRPRIRCLTGTRTGSPRVLRASSGAFKKCNFREKALFASARTKIRHCGESSKGCATCLPEKTFKGTPVCGASRHETMEEVSFSRRWLSTERVGGPGGIVGIGQPMPHSSTRAVFRFRKPQQGFREPGHAGEHEAPLAPGSPRVGSVQTGTGRSPACCPTGVHGAATGPEQGPLQMGHGSVAW